eukprot:TRINITY_DN2676_c0_g2_i2.p1 TRINITY_DN2676_c0_g2~~TRINITY_DN2676_c0_g2_i2.p1  ORF type:complete len:430 (+),score=74.20 TRINITY_DN2676_c0_g2_i2:64-1290(+)
MAAFNETVISALGNEIDRDFLFKVEEDVLDLLSVGLASTKLWPPLNSYYRLLIHQTAARCSCTSKSIGHDAMKQTAVHSSSDSKRPVLRYADFFPAVEARPVATTTTPSSTPIRKEAPSPGTAKTESTRRARPTRGEQQRYVPPRLRQQAQPQEGEDAPQAVEQKQQIQSASQPLHEPTTASKDDDSCESGDTMRGSSVVATALDAVVSDTCDIAPPSAAVDSKEQTIAQDDIEAVSNELPKVTRPLLHDYTEFQLAAASAGGGGKSSDAAASRFTQEHILELHGLTASDRTSDVEQYLAAYKPMGLQIRWVDDTKALIVFRSVQLAQSALRALPKQPFEVKPFELSSEHAAGVNARGIQPKERPQTTTAVVRRLIAGALNVRIPRATGVDVSAKRNARTDMTQSGTD